MTTGQVENRSRNFIRPSRNEKRADETDVCQNACLEKEGEKNATR
jgi:hypothetical protein